MRPYSWGLYAQPVLLGQRPAQSEYTVPLRQCTWWYTLVGEKVIDSRPSDILSAIVRREEERILASLLGERRWGLLELVRAIDHYFLYILGLDEKDREEEVKSDRWDLCRKTGGTAKTSVEMSCPEELAFREGRLEKIREAMAALEAEAQAAAEQAVRQGITADRSGFAKRLWRLRDGPMPGALLVLMADAVRLRHARRLLSTPRPLSPVRASSGGPGSAESPHPIGPLRATALAGWRGCSALAESPHLSVARRCGGASLYAVEQRPRPAPNVPLAVVVQVVGVVLAGAAGELQARAG